MGTNVNDTELDNRGDDLRRASPSWGALGSAAVLAAVLCLVTTPALAEVSPLAQASTWTFPDLVSSATEGRLLSGHSAGGFSLPGGPREGFLIGVDLGAAIPIPTGGLESQTSVALGARVGYQLRSGLSLAFQYEDLGLAPTLVDGTQWQIAALGARYEFPFLIPMPYVEVAVGLSFVNANAPLAPGQGNVSVEPAGGLGVGMAIPFGHHFAIDVGARDWLTPVNGTLLQVISLQAGIELIFGGGAQSP